MFVGSGLNYIAEPVLVLGPLKLHSAGALFGVAILVGVSWSLRRAGQRGVSRDLVRNTLVVTILAGIVTAFLTHALGAWLSGSNSQGVDSSGALAGGALACVLYVRWKRASLLAVLDVIIQGVIIGWGIGRIGCALAHDHPGCVTDFALGFDYPSGALGPGVAADVRHNLGFYEAGVVLMLLHPAVCLLHGKSTLRPGTIFASTILAYASIRFGMDFLRATDVPQADLRHYGFTTMQLLCVPLVAVANAILLRRHVGCETRAA